MSQQRTPGGCDVEGFVDSEGDQRDFLTALQALHFAELKHRSQQVTKELAIRVTKLRKIHTDLVFAHRKRVLFLEEAHARNVLVNEAYPQCQLQQQAVFEKRIRLYANLVEQQKKRLLFNDVWWPQYTRLLLKDHYAPREEKKRDTVIVDEGDERSQLWRRARASHKSARLAQCEREEHESRHVAVLEEEQHEWVALYEDRFLPQRAAIQEREYKLYFKSLEEDEGSLRDALVAAEASEQYISRIAGWAYISQMELYATQYMSQHVEVFLRSIRFSCFFPHVTTSQHREHIFLCAEEENDWNRMLQQQHDPFIRRHKESKASVLIARMTGAYAARKHCGLTRWVRLAVQRRLQTEGCILVQACLRSIYSARIEVRSRQQQHAALVIQQCAHAASSFYGPCAERLARARLSIALRLQRCGRGLMGREELFEAYFLQAMERCATTDRHHACALVIQHAWRGYCQTRERRQRRRERAEAKRRETAATSIAKMMRGFLARRHVNSRKAEIAREHATLRLQRILKGAIVRCILHRILYTRRIQTFVRGYQSTRYVVDRFLSPSALRIQCAFRCAQARECRQRLAASRRSVEEAVMRQNAGMIILRAFVLFHYKVGRDVARARVAGERRLEQEKLIKKALRAQERAGRLDADDDSSDAADDSRSQVVFDIWRIGRGFLSRRGLARQQKAWTRATLLIQASLRQRLSQKEHLTPRQAASIQRLQERLAEKRAVVLQRFAWSAVTVHSTIIPRVAAQRRLMEVHLRSAQLLQRHVNGFGDRKQLHHRRQHRLTSLTLLQSVLRWREASVVAKTLERQATIARWQATVRAATSAIARWVFSVCILPKRNAAKTIQCFFFRHRERMRRNQELRAAQIALHHSRQQHMLKEILRLGSLIASAEHDEFFFTILKQEEVERRQLVARLNPVPSASLDSAPRNVGAKQGPFSYSCIFESPSKVEEGHHNLAKSGDAATTEAKPPALSAASMADQPSNGATATATASTERSLFLPCNTKGKAAVHMPEHVFFPSTSTGISTTSDRASVDPHRDACDAALSALFAPTGAFSCTPTPAPAPIGSIPMASLLAMIEVDEDTARSELLQCVALAHRTLHVPQFALLLVARQEDHQRHQTLTNEEHSAFLTLSASIQERLSIYQRQEAMRTRTSLQRFIADEALLRERIVRDRRDAWRSLQIYHRTRVGHLYTHLYLKETLAEEQSARDVYVLDAESEEWKEIAVMMDDILSYQAAKEGGHTTSPASTGAAQTAAAATPESRLESLQAQQRPTGSSSANRQRGSSGFVSRKKSVVNTTLSTDALPAATTRTASDTGGSRSFVAQQLLQKQQQQRRQQQTTCDSVAVTTNARKEEQPSTDTVPNNNDSMPTHESIIVSRLRALLIDREQTQQQTQQQQRYNMKEGSACSSSTSSNTTSRAAIPLSHTQRRLVPNTAEGTAAAVVAAAPPPSSSSRSVDSGLLPRPHGVELSMLLALDQFKPPTALVEFLHHGIATTGSASSPISSCVQVAASADAGTVNDSGIVGGGGGLVVSLVVDADLNTCASLSASSPLESQQRYHGAYIVQHLTAIADDYAAILLLNKNRTTTTTDGTRTTTPPSSSHPLRPSQTAEAAAIHVLRLSRVNGDPANAATDAGGRSSRLVAQRAVLMLQVLAEIENPAALSGAAGTQKTLSSPSPSSSGLLLASLLPTPAAVLDAVPLLVKARLRRMFRDGDVRRGSTASAEPKTERGGLGKQAEGGERAEAEEDVSDKRLRWLQRETVHGRICYPTLHTHHFLRSEGYIGRRVQELRLQRELREHDENNSNNDRNNKSTAVTRHRGAGPAVTLTSTPQCWTLDLSAVIVEGLWHGHHHWHRGGEEPSPIDDFIGGAGNDKNKVGAFSVPTAPPTTAVMPSELFAEALAQWLGKSTFSATSAATKTSSASSSAPFYGQCTGTMRFVSRLVVVAPSDGVFELGPSPVLPVSVLNSLLLAHAVLAVVSR